MTGGKLEEKTEKTKASEDNTKSQVMKHKNMAFIENRKFSTEAPARKTLIKALSTAQIDVAE